MNMYERREPGDKLPSKVSYLRRIDQFEAEIIEVYLDEELQIIDNKTICTVNLTPE